MIAPIAAVLDLHRDDVLFAYLFGSAAEGAGGPLSDVDIAVYFSGKEAPSLFDRALSLHADLCRALRRNDVDLVTLNTARNIVMLDEIVRKGLVLIDRDAGLRHDFEQRVLHEAIDFRQQRVALMGV